MNLSSFFKLIFTSLLLFFNIITIHSQNFDTQLNLKDSTQVHILILDNGKKLRGRIISIQNENVLFYSKKKKVETTFQLAEIKKIKVADHLDWNKKTYEKPLRFSNYLFFTNTAFTLQKGEKNYRTFMGLSMQGTKGLGDGTEISFGYSFPFMLNASLKLAIPLNQKSRLAYKTTILSSPIFRIDSDESTFIFSNSLVSTIGNTDRFLNIALKHHWLKTNDFFISNASKVFYTLSIGGGFRMSDRWQLIIEDRAIASTDGLFYFDLIPSIGLSYSADQFNISFGFHSVDQVGFNYFPVIDFSENDLITFFPTFLKNIPFLSYTRTF